LAAMQEEDELVLEAARKAIPKLSFEQHKGQAGRIGVVGGSEEYTGAPYFAAISAMKAGADLAHVFCTKSASPVIKSYSPELIVHPLFKIAQYLIKTLPLISYPRDAPKALDLINEWLPRLHAVVIGPGLGRVDSILSTVKDIILALKQNETPVVIDADGLFLITKEPSIIHGYTRGILTPNIIEFRRLSKALNLPCTSEDLSGSITETIALSQALGGVTIVRKGIIATMNEAGSPRRCGGQGDLLSGVMALFSFWTHNRCCKIYNSFSLKWIDAGAVPPTLLAGYAACLLTKRCAAQAYRKSGRSTTTTDLVAEINSVFSNTFEQK
uniref:ATP-dependent (S)-NAD(P)H-hydrate dehydratase n=1 Tax=Ciona savignyi TaxID=51511 RepID=H2YYE2_CIOSA